MLLLRVGVLAAIGVAWFVSGGLHAATKRPPAIEPDLRIVQATLAPESYVASSGSLDLIVEIDLPTYLDAQLVLEVSSLISSPSKRSMRFLSIRQPLTVPSPKTDDHLTVTLTWDGKDQHAQVVGAGRYTYEVQAKLLVVGEKGPRTFMRSWPKRGTIEIK